MIIIIISGVTIVIFDMCHLQSHHDCCALVTYYFWWSSMHQLIKYDFSFSNLCHIPAQFPRWEESRHPEQPKLNCLEPACQISCCSAGIFGWILYFQGWIFLGWIFFRSESFSGVNIFPGVNIFRVNIFRVNIFRVNIFMIWIFPSEDFHSLLGLV